MSKKLIVFLCVFVISITFVLPCFALNNVRVTVDTVDDYLDLPDSFTLFIGSKTDYVNYDIYTYRSSIYFSITNPSRFSLSYYVLSDDVWTLYSSTANPVEIDMTNYDAVRIRREPNVSNPVNVGVVEFSSNYPTENKGLSVFYHLFRASGVNDDTASVGVIVISSILILSLIVFVFKICFGRKR